MEVITQNNCLTSNRKQKEMREEEACEGLKEVSSGL